MKDQNLDQPLDQAHKLPAESTASARQPSSPKTEASSPSMLSSKRRLLVSSLIGGSATSVLAASTDNWHAPVVRSILLPAHAQATNATDPVFPVDSVVTFSGGVDLVEAEGATAVISVNGPINVFEDDQVTLKEEELGGINLRIGDDDLLEDPVSGIKTPATAPTDDTGTDSISADPTITDIDTSAEVAFLLAKGIGQTGRYRVTTGSAARPFPKNRIVIEQYLSDEFDNENGDESLNGVSPEVVYTNDSDVELLPFSFTPFEGAKERIEPAQATARITVRAGYVAGDGDEDHYMSIGGVGIDLGREDLTTTEIADMIATELNAANLSFMATADGSVVNLTQKARTDTYETDESPVASNGLDGAAGNITLTVQNPTYNTA